MTEGSKHALPQAGEAHLRRVVEASHDGLWLLTLSGGVEYMNARARALLGLPPGEQPQVELRSLWPEASSWSLDRALAGAADGQIQKFRAFFYRDGAPPAYWETVVSPLCDDNGEVCELVAVSRDVTTEVETQAFLETLVQNLPAPLTVKSVQDRRFVLMNLAAEELLNLSPGEGLGRTAEELLSAPDATVLAMADAKVLASGEMLTFEQPTPPAGDRAGRYFTFKLLATHDDLGARHLISIGDDVTEQRAAAESLRTALAAAEQASEAKSTFLANMSHELRTPLNGIVAGADMLARGELSERSQELVAMIRASSETLEHLLSDILDLARVESGQVVLEAKPFHLVETVRSVAGLFQLPARQKGLDLEIVTDPSLDGMAVGDMGRLRQVLGNLLSNAVKFTEQGRIVLDARRTETGAARFTISDTGIGFDPTTKARLFERFQQADGTFSRQFDGAGLGLSISRELVQLMAGTLDCDSTPGAGARFWFEVSLPAHADQSAGGPTPSPQPELGLRILLADDHPTNRQVVELMLGGVADIVAVENGAEAVDAFHAQAFDLVLMDMQMPVMDGLAAVREIRTLETVRGTPATPIIMLTANAGSEHRAASAQAGADLHLGKPITTHALFSAIENVLAEPEHEGNLYANLGIGRP